MEVVWQVENDPYCNKVLAKHWPHVKRYGDIKEIDFTRTEPVDLICGGFPCQPVSCAGNRRGDKDARWLWPEFYRAVCEARPRRVLVENVPGLLSADFGRLFGGILRDLASSGYNAEWDLLPAAAFGAPHLRFRLFLVAYARSGICSGRPDQPGREAQGRIAPGGHGEVVADTDCPAGITKGAASKEILGPEAEQRPGRCSGGESTSSNSILRGLSERGRIFSRGQEADAAITPSEWWSVEPNVGRVAHGIPARVDRLKCLGNAVVPQVAEWLGRRIMEAHHAHL